MPRINGINYTQIDNLNIRRNFLIDSLPVTTKVIMNESSVALDQSPTATDNPIRIEFGPGKTAEGITLDNTGLLTFSEERGYLINVWLQIGRTGAAGVSRMFIRALVNGANIAGIPPFVSEIDNANSIYTDQFRGNLQFNAGDTLEFELVRDSSGNNSGSLIGLQPTLPGWPFAPSARIIISEVGTGEDAT